MEVSVNLRERVLENIYSADEKLLGMIQALINDYRKKKSEIAVPDWFYAELAARRERYLKGESKAHSWEKIAESARNKALRHEA